MLYHVIRLWSFALLVLVTSCLSEEEKLERMRQEFATEQPELNQIRIKVFSYSTKHIGLDEYWHVHQSLNDTLESWGENQLLYYSNVADSTWQTDSIICFNQQKDKARACILRVSKGGVMDAIKYINCVKINGLWCFLGGGGVMYLPREYYQEDIHTPLSFETLQLLATKYVYKKYLKKNDNGAWEINDKFFSDFTSGAWCTTCRTQREWDSVYLYQVKRNWSKRSNQ